MVKSKMFAIIASIAVVTVGTIVYLNSMNSASDTFKPEFEADQFKEQTTAGATAGIKVPGYSTIYVPHGATDVEVNFFNPEENDVYFEICLVIADTEQEIYKSKLLSPGQHLYSITLTDTLDKGTYDMNIIYNTYSMDEEYTPKNGATVACELVVE